jgi:hypothetical protein
MKKLFHLDKMFWNMVLVVILTDVQIISAQPGKEKQLQIPENISTIFQTSCMPCHGSKGSKVSTSKVNFSAWSDYEAPKEAEIASLVCSSVSKGTMPPRSIRYSKPETIPTKEQIDLICKWAESFKPDSGEK